MDVREMLNLAGQIAESRGLEIEGCDCCDVVAPVEFVRVGGDRYGRSGLLEAYPSVCVVCEAESDRVFSVNARVDVEEIQAYLEEVQ